jgi:hypothetical protein
MMMIEAQAWALNTWTSLTLYNFEPWGLLDPPSANSPQGQGHRTYQDYPFGDIENIRGGLLDLPMNLENLVEDDEERLMIPIPFWASLVP